MFRYTKGIAVREVILWIITACALFPFWILIVTALKPTDQLYTTSAAVPTAIDFSSFVSVLTDERNNVARALVNSILITVIALAGLLVFGSLCAYVIARSTRAWTKVTFYLVLIAILLPTQLGTLPLYIGAKSLGLTGTIWGVALVWIGMLMPFAVFLYAGFFRSLSTEYEEAAAIDGATPAQTFFRVVLPIMGPATGTVAILTGLIVWNDFFTSLLFLSGSDAQTIPVTMYYFVGGSVTEWNKIFAIVIISMVPILVFYVFAQKQFMQGYSGGVKG
ncbi:MAG: ABC transporter permease [Microbacterium sp. SCN 70-200]|uniref:carbohydrate ABC transporter permease n=1 Tax=unclassified Microbacterium TaxID=2609290 RepID=UPI0008692F40|nr:MULTISPECIES: carbohydrate ABC transporter permease [unclassified Microbacterium]MBN9213333.1 carbohydrate ABC transporter permease [Microbacterium sp.]ODT40544.1 MAG: ABC transporter permease [Microbacterium sp. SCN 70-200]OJV84984.1 MAG: ABC transporter permease [Microbacterium sp. 70-16]